ncbi:CIC11C00000004193 [Sungouiella intermedia]|uniref:CIC11C00000004193 n=1 Tax=Sungouiella intermedia TaxID=45354 RepID=A0A1L0DK76_9ASCO|nr:CIC11C00000004193 [[Candida] intermedia]
MASYYDNTFVLQSMAFQQKHTMHPIFDSAHLNCPKNLENRVASPSLQYPGSHDDLLKLEDDITRAHHVEVNLPSMWSNVPQNMNVRSYSHDYFPMATSSNQTLSTELLLFDEDYQMGHKSQYSVDSAVSMSPPSMVSASSAKSNLRKIVKPRIATLYWEEEQTTCYQVRAHNVVVSRRENDNYINGTKLLNVTGMTRGKRDGMLKIEKGRLVVRNGSMNLKGVWIPFNRAIEIARNEGVDHLLYPLFVENILDFFRNHGQELRQDAMLDGDEEGEHSDNRARTSGVSGHRSQSSQSSQGCHGSRMFY